MQNRLTFILFAIHLFMALSSCDIQSNYSVKQSESKMGFDELTVLLSDILIAEAAVKDKSLLRDTFNFRSIKDYYSAIFKIHNVEETDFVQSMNFYHNRPDSLTTLLKAVDLYLDNEIKKKEVARPPVSK